MTFDHVCARVLANDLDLYELDKSLLLCETFKHPAGFKTYHVFIACGDLREILEFQRFQLLEEARLRGCVSVTFAGREGWRKVLETEGWKFIRITMTKDVD